MIDDQTRRTARTEECYAPYPMHKAEAQRRAPIVGRPQLRLRIRHLVVAALIVAGCGARSTTAPSASTKPSTAASVSNSAFSFKVADRNVGFNIGVPHGINAHITNSGDEVGVEFKDPTRYRVVVRVVHTPLSTDEFARSIFDMILAKDAATLAGTRDKKMDGHPGKEAVFIKTRSSDKFEVILLDVTVCGGVGFLASCTAVDPKWAKECPPRLDSFRVVNCDWEQ